MINSLVLLLLAASPDTTPPTVDPKSPDYIVIASTETVLQKNYPKESVALGEQGVVQFKIRTSGQGDLGACQVIGSSGYARLDYATCDLLIGKTIFKKVVKNGRTVRGDRYGQVNWILPNMSRTATPPPKSSAAEIAKAGEVYMCHYSQKTGSLVSRTKQCMRSKDFQAYNLMIEQEIDRLKGNSWQQNSN